MDYVLPELPTLRHCKVVALDTETYDPDLQKRGAGWATGNGKLIGISVAADGVKPVYLPVLEHYGVGYPMALLKRWAKRELCVDGQVTVGANLMYDLGWLGFYGIDIPQPYYDVQRADVLLDENLQTYKLDAIAERRLGEQKFSGELVEWVRNNLGAAAAKNPYAHIHAVPVDIVSRYAEQDAALPLAIREHQLPEIVDQDLEYTVGLEHRLIPLLIAMRMKGVRIDTAQLRKVEAYFNESLEDSMKVLNKLAGHEINVDAPTHLVPLFEKAGLEYSRTATGRPSFSADALAKVDHPITRAILTVRKYGKMKGTFIDGYMAQAHNGRLHAEFHPLRSDDFGTVSGRFSSSRPNLQNIPARDKVLAPMIRSLFIPEEGELWGAADWSQVEYRVMLCFAKGYEAEQARQMFITDPTTDFHQMVADMVGIERSPAKTINFGILYGMGIKTLMAALGISEEEATAILDTYHRQAPYVKELSNKVTRLATTHGYVTSLSGRRHRFPRWEMWGSDTKFSNREEAVAYAKENGLGFPRRAATHTALNRKVQGSAADIMKEAMVVCWEAGVFDVLTPLITVHDEMDVSVPNNKVGAEAFDEMCNVMERVGFDKYDLPVPLLVDANKGNNWAEAK
jgi:DNA polymerase I-like protein with 3'-5' exonuclease and polymerase domains